MPTSFLTRRMIAYFEKKLEEKFEHDEMNKAEKIRPVSYMNKNKGPRDTRTSAGTLYKVQSLASIYRHLYIYIYIYIYTPLRAYLKYHSRIEVMRPKAIYS